MRKLTKILSIVLAIIVLIGFATPLGMGFLVQKRYPEAIAAFTHSPNIGLKVVHFDRGWFRSRAQLQVTIYSTQATISGEPIALAQFVLNQTIQHGLIIRVKSLDGSWHLKIARAAMHNESQDDNLLLQSDTLWTLTDHINTALNVKHLLVGNEQQRLELKDLAGQINFTPSDQHFESDLTIAGAEIFAANPQKVENNIIDLIKVFSVHGFSARMDIKKIDELWYGVRHFAAQQAVMYPYIGAAITANNWSVDLNQTNRDTLTDVNFINHIDTIASPQLKVGDLQISLALTGVNTASLENFSRASIYGSILPRLKLYALLMELFGKGVTIDLSQLQFNTDEGPVALQARITSPVLPGNGGFLYLLHNTDAQAKIQLPKSWLQKGLIHFYQNQKDAHPNLKIDPRIMAVQQMEFWFAHHLLVAQAQQVATTLNYKQGELRINGEKPALDTLILNSTATNHHD